MKTKIVVTTTSLETFKDFFWQSDIAKKWNEDNRLYVFVDKIGINNGFCELGLKNLIDMKSIVNPIINEIDPDHILTTYRKCILYNELIKNNFGDFYFTDDDCYFCKDISEYELISASKDSLLGLTIIKKYKKYNNIPSYSKNEYHVGNFYWNNSEENNNIYQLYYNEFNDWLKTNINNLKHTDIFYLDSILLNNIFSKVQLNQLKDVWLYSRKGNGLFNPNRHICLHFNARKKDKSLINEYFVC